MQLEKRIQEIAKLHAVSSEAVRTDMESAMLQAFHSQTPESRRLWEAIAPEGTPPTLERLILCLAVMVAAESAS